MFVQPIFCDSLVSAQLFLMKQQQRWVFIWHNNGIIIFDVFLYQNINMLVGDASAVAGVLQLLQLSLLLMN